MDQSSDIVELVKQRCRIEDIVSADGYELEQRGGRYRRARAHDSLVVDVRNQAYHWNSKSEHGDVINWVMRRQGADFKTAILLLCKRAGLPEPNWGEQDNAQRLAARSREDAFSLAAGIFIRWLWKDADALAYARSRAWSDETIRGAMLGYTGAGSNRKALLEELRGELVNVGIDIESPAAVSLLGWRGVVAEWANRYQVKVPQAWMDQGYIPGLVGRDMLVYAHYSAGRVRYFSGRGVHDKIHYNLPVELAGERQPYMNWTWSSAEEDCVIVEGQADAVSLGQLGMPAVAMAGTTLNENLRAQLRGHRTLYLGMDDDQAGKIASWKIAKGLGPMVRLVRWPSSSEGGDGSPAGKDANDWLKTMANVEKVEPEQQQARMTALLRNARTFVEEMASWAGEQEGSARDEAVKQTAELAGQMDPITWSQYRSKLAKSLGQTVRDFEHLVRTIQAQNGTGNTPDEPGILVDTIGGYFDEHLVELVYDPDSIRTRLAVRYPDGHLEVVDRLDIGDTRYVPTLPNAMILKNVVLFPSDLAPLRPTRELVGIVRGFIHTYLDVDEFYERLASYYVLFTWLYDSFQVLPYLRALGDYGTGKSRFLWAVGVLCYRPIFTGGATTVSPIFRLLDYYKGTLVLDEADYSQSDEAAQIIKILNTGYMKGVPVIRSVDRGTDGYQPEAYEVYGPKVIATRKKFMDRATESRCLTKEMGGGVPRIDIPIVLPKQFYSQAREIRNLLLAYRMKHWVPEAEVDYNSVDRSIEPRLNQVTMALKTIVDDADLKDEVDRFIRAYNRQMVVERSMMLEAKVLEALMRIKAGKPIGEDEHHQPLWDLSLRNVAAVTNDVIDQENKQSGMDEEEEEEDAKRFKKKLGPKRIGAVVRNQLQLATERATSGPYKGNYYVVWSEERITALCHRYGIDPPGVYQAPEAETGGKPKPEQKKIPF